MRCLHIVDALDNRGPVHALLHLLHHAALESAPDVVSHDVLALAGGPLESAIKAHARRTTAVAIGLEVTATILTGDYDLVHVLDRVAARRLAPLLTAGTAAVLVYSAPALERGPGHTMGPGGATERAILAASDLVFVSPSAPSTANLAPPLLHRSVCLDLARLSASSPVTDDPVADDLESSEARFIVREWTAALLGAQRQAEAAAHPQVVHP